VRNRIQELLENGLDELMLLTTRSILGGAARRYRRNAANALARLATVDWA
jgi:hypothetical protein